LLLGGYGLTKEIVMTHKKKNINKKKLNKLSKDMIKTGKELKKIIRGGHGKGETNCAGPGLFFGSN
jgi:hypothetical protein